MKFEEVNFEQIENMLTVKAGVVSDVAEIGGCFKGCEDGGGCATGCGTYGSCGVGCGEDGQCIKGCGGPTDYDF